MKKQELARLGALRLGVSICAVACAAESATAFAQDDIGVSLEEIVVTAQKRSENLQEVPAVVSAFSGDFVENAGWHAVDKLENAVPSVVFDGPSRSRPWISIRGIGSSRFDLGSEQSVGVFVDDVYQTRASSVLSSLVDVERIEILRGPQGTLYGRNTIGGAINIISRKPTNETEGRVSAGFGNDGTYSVGGMLSGALAEDKVLARVSAAYSDYEGGMFDTNAGTDNGEEETALKATFVVIPNDAHTLTLNASYTRAESDLFFASAYFVSGPIPFASPFTVAAQPGVIAEANSDRRSAALNASETSGEFRENTSLSAKFEGGYDNVDLTWIASATWDDTGAGGDFDGHSLDVLRQYADQSSFQHTQEVRLSSVPGGALTFGDKLEWLLGAYYFHEDGSRRDRYWGGKDSVFSLLDTMLNGAAPGSEPFTTYDVDLQTESFAFFGQGTWALTEKAGLTVGLRYTHDKKSFVYDASASAPNIPPVYAPFTIEDAPVFSSVDPRITLDYQLTDDALVYATYTQGFKSGGVQYAVGDPVAAAQYFEPEHLSMVEVGLKSRLLDNRLQLNAAAYHYDFKDQQLLSLAVINGTPTAVTQNAGRSKYFGFELDSIAAITPDFTLTANYAFTDAAFDEFLSPVMGDLSGNRVPRAPKHAFTLGANYLMSLSDDATIEWRAEYAWKDDYFLEVTNHPVSVQEDTGVLNVSATVALVDEKLKLRFYCDNCTNELLVTQGQLQRSGEGTQVNFSYDLPRRYGVSLSYSF